MERTDIRMIIGRNIRHRRVLAGLSQKALANHLGINFQQMQK
jgi:transcriptional regulator with XRE-family HTH domain